MATVPRLRAFNFFYFSLFALFISFLPVYCERIGISGTQIGFIIGFGSIISIFSQPFWGMVSDKFRTIKSVLLLILTISILIGTFLYQSNQIWTISLFVMLMYVFYLPTDPLVESMNFQTAQSQKVTYGSVRMYGAMGYAATSLLAGFAIQFWGIRSLSWIFLTFGIVTLLLALGMKDVRASSKPALFHHLKDFFMQSHTLMFFILVLIVAIPHKMNDIFIGLYIDQLGGDVQLTGLAWFVMTITETLFFAVISRIIKPGKETVIMTIAAGLYALRFLLCSFVVNPYVLVGLQVFQGFTFVFFYTGAIQYLHSIVPEMWKSTGQTVLTVLFFGVSGIVGSTFGGWLLDSVGGSSLYRVMAILAFISFIFSLRFLRSSK